MDAFRQIADVEEEFHELDVEGRVIPYRHRAGGVVWFDFEVICGGPRSQLDYLDLAQRFHTIILSERAPALGEARERGRAASRWLVDIFYDCRRKADRLGGGAGRKRCIAEGATRQASSSAPRAG